MGDLSTSALALGLALAAGAASAECGIEAGSVRILSNEFPALDAVIEAPRECASDTVTVEANSTAEHSELQIPAPSGNPAEYTVKIAANDSTVPLLNAGLVRPLDGRVAEYGENLDFSQLIKINGRTMAIAFMANARHLTYHRDLLEQAGVEPPTSYEKVLVAAEALKVQGIEAPIGANNEPGWDLAEEFVNTYLRMGGEFFAEGSDALDPAKAVAALEMMRSLAAHMQPGSASQGVIASAQAGAKPSPMVAQMGVLHGALGAELADFMPGSETADQALADLAAAYATAAREQGFLQ